MLLIIMTLLVLITSHCDGGSLEYSRYPHADELHIVRHHDDVQEQVEQVETLTTSLGFFIVQSIFFQFLIVPPSNPSIPKGLLFYTSAKTLRSIMLPITRIPRVTIARKLYLASITSTNTSRSRLLHSTQHIQRISSQSGSVSRLSTSSSALSAVRNRGGLSLHSGITSRRTLASVASQCVFRSFSPVNHFLPSSIQPLCLSTSQIGMKADHDSPFRSNRPCHRIHHVQTHTKPYQLRTPNPTTRRTNDDITFPPMSAYTQGDGSCQPPPCAH